MLRIGRAPAKLNLALELLGRRHDGLHLLAAVSQTIDWCDVVAIDLAPRSGRQPRLRVLGPAAAEVPVGGANLAARAGALVSAEAGAVPLRSIALQKRIPTRSGLGGGSADAAAVLRLAGAGLVPGRLLELALACGSDVPFALLGGAASVQGVGEQLSPLPPLTRGAFVVVILGRIATAAAYANSEAADFSTGGRSARLASTLSRREPLDPALLGSGLQAAAERVDPELRPKLRRLREATPGVQWAMTGSGGAFFSYTTEAAQAARQAQSARQVCPGAPVRVALPVSSDFG